MATNLKLKLFDGTTENGTKKVIDVGEELKSNRANIEKHENQIILINQTIVLINATLKALEVAIKKILDS